MKTKKILLASIFVLTFFLNAGIDAETIHNTKTTSIVQTKPVRHWYAGGFVGTNIATSGDTKIPGLTSFPDYDTGYILGINVGHRFDHSFRIEGEFTYQDLPFNKVDDAVGRGTTTKMHDSETTLFTLFVNGYYEFRLFQRCTPYLGFGIGYVDVDNTIKPTTPVQIGPNLFIFKKTIDYNVFGYQGILGINYKLRDHADLELNYKYFSTVEGKGRGKTNLGSEPNKTEQKVVNNIISVGFRYFFH